MSVLLLFDISYVCDVPVWCSGNALDSINVVTLRRARWVPWRVTIFEWVNHLVTEPGTKVESAWAISLWVGKSEYWLWLRPSRKWRVHSCVTVGLVTRTAGILAYSRLKALAGNGAGHTASVGRMLAEYYWGQLSLAQSAKRGWAASQRSLTLFVKSSSWCMHICGILLWYITSFISLQATSRTRLLTFVFICKPFFQNYCVEFQFVIWMLCFWCDNVNLLKH